MSAPPAGSASNPAVRRRPGPIVAVVSLIIVGAFAALAVAALIVGGSRERMPTGNSTPGDPGSFRSTGTAALAQTLAAHGVAVRVARDQQELRGWPEATPSTVVVISRATSASESSTRILRDKTRHARRIVVLDPRSEVLDQWGVSTAVISSTGSTLTSAAQCSVAGIAPADRAGHSATIIVAGADAVICFRDPLTPTGGAVVVYPATAAHPEIVVAQQDWFRNGAILANDHAGIAVRMIGAGTQVQWFAPNYTDLMNDNPEPMTQAKLEPDVPRWLWPMAGLGAFVLIALMLWRGRRFGQLITEPLPAVVKAAETTEARGRLYQASKDARRAAAQLRGQALRTIPQRLGVSRHAPVDDIVAAVSRATGRDLATVYALLAGPLPVDDDGLVAFATDLSTLEEEVRPVL